MALQKLNNMVRRRTAQYSIALNNELYRCSYLKTV